MPAVAHCSNVQHDTQFNVICLTIELDGVGYSFLQGPSTCMVRPHPAVWKIIHGVVILYMLALVFLLFQNADDARLLLKVRRSPVWQLCSHLALAHCMPGKASTKCLIMRKQVTCIQDQFSLNLKLMLLLSNNSHAPARRPAARRCLSHNMQTPPKI